MRALKAFLFVGMSILFPLFSLAQSAPPFISGINGGGAVELGQNVILTANVGLGNPPVVPTYQWRKDGNDIPGANSVSYQVGVVTAASTGTYAVVVTNAAGSSVASIDVTVKPAAVPVFTLQPRSLSVQVGQPVPMSFIATGSFPRTYQWRKDGIDIVGATQASYTISAATTAHAGVYTVVVTNSVGSTTSAPASLTVNAATPPVFGSGSPSDSSPVQGSQITLSTFLSSGSSPFTYQWFKDGSAIAGATNSALTLGTVALSDAGKYSVVVTNAAGSATSRDATLTVTAATPATFSAHPQSQTVVEAQAANFFVSVNGSSPLTLQWQKNGTPISGATSSSYSINAVTAADAGNYTVVATNVLGSVTSSAAVLTVNPAVAPTITVQPANQSLAYFGGITLSVQISGSSPLTYLWKKDGVALPGGTQSGYAYFGATPAQAGRYTVTATNVAGSVTSNAAVITVTSAVAARITKQPVSLQVAAGLTAQFDMGVDTAGAGQVTFQWFKGGLPVPEATGGTLYFGAVKDSDAGNYTVVVTGVGGAVTSDVAKLTVLPAAPPRLSYGYWPADLLVTVGGNANLSLGNLSGSGPFTYQWFKDGVALPGVTSGYFNLNSVQESDAGTYVLLVSNDAGAVATPPVRLRIRPAATTPWLDVARLNDTVYFLATSPSRIERYDLAGERWLSPAYLSETQIPTAFAPTAEGVYVAYGRSLVRRSPDLSTETPLLNVGNAISSLIVNGDLLYYDNVTLPGPFGGTGPGTASIHRSTLQTGPSFLDTYSHVTFSAQQPLGYSAAGDAVNGIVQSFSIGADGTFNYIPAKLSYLYTIRGGTRTYLLPGETYIANDGGTVYRTSDLSYVGSFGDALNDLALLSDGTAVLLRDRALISASSTNFMETGRTSLPFAGLRAFARNNSIFVFGAPATTGGSPQATKVSSTSFQPAVIAPVGPPSGERFSIDDVFFNDGVVGVLSRSKQAVFRWSASSRAYLSTVPLRGAPRVSAQQPGGARALLTYIDGQITEVPINANASVAERQIASVGNLSSAATDLGDLVMLNVTNVGSTGERRMVLNNQGLSIYLSDDGTNWGTGLAWQAGARRLYSVGQFPYDKGAQCETVPTSGVLPGSYAAGSVTNADAAPPLRFNPEGTLIAASNGRVLNAELGQVGALANNILDAAWLPTGLYTIRSLDGATQVQQWSRITYLQGVTLSLPGVPLRIFRLSDSQLIVVTSVLGNLSFNLLNADLSPATTTAFSVAGTYFANIAPGSSQEAGNVALFVRSDRTGVLLVNSTGTTRFSLLATDVTLASDGTFAVSARGLNGVASRSVSGRISPDGSFTGSIPSSGLTFSGAQSTGASSIAAFYQVPAVNGSTGSAYAIVGADSRVFVLAQNASAVDGGMGALDANRAASVQLSSGARLTASLTIDSASLAVAASAGVFAGTQFSGLRDGLAHTDRLANISTRGRAGSGSDMMTAGFVIAGNAPRQILVRAIGPSLAAFGINGFLPRPHLVLYHGSTIVAASDNWGLTGRVNEITAASTQVGAFPLPADSADAAIVTTLNPGDYTAQVTSFDGTSSGTALVEVYDAGTGSGASVPHLIDIATLGRVTSDDLVIAGIVVTGNAPKRVLVRAVGPTLTSSLGVPGTLSDPVLTILSGSTPICTNDDWVNASTASTPGEVAAASIAAGAFPLAPGGKDAAIVITLQPGNYTAIISGKSGATGVALVEVYEVNN